MAAESVYFMLTWVKTEEQERGKNKQEIGLMATTESSIFPSFPWVMKSNGPTRPRGTRFEISLPLAPFELVTF
ncbi:alpha-L-fucosidase [Sesbania bispinosa]|nr:alpha-L-fucosidase [Sesbania bispinosa]